MTISLSRNREWSHLGYNIIHPGHSFPPTAVLGHIGLIVSPSPKSEQLQAHIHLQGECFRLLSSVIKNHCAKGWTWAVPTAERWKNLSVSLCLIPAPHSWSSKRVKFILSRNLKKRAGRAKQHNEIQGPAWKKKCSLNWLDSIRAPMSCAYQIVL